MEWTWNLFLVEFQTYSKVCNSITNAAQFHLKCQIASKLYFLGFNSYLSVDPDYFVQKIISFESRGIIDSIVALWV